LKKLTTDLEMKLLQRDEMKEQQRLKKAGMAPGDDMNEEADVDVDTRSGDVDLFGEEDESGMDVS
jgi:transcription initiation factor TFIID subunit 7